MDDSGNFLANWDDDGPVHEVAQLFGADGLPKSEQLEGGLALR